jgi:hypothetical protein
MLLALLLALLPVLPLKKTSDSGLPADVLVNKFKKDISFALRRGTIAQVTTHQASPCPRRYAG